MDEEKQNKEHAYLKSIKVEGFKSIRSMDLELKPLNVLIGANGSGKSNFLNVFRVMQEVAKGACKKYLRNTGRLRRWSSSSARRSWR